jgi:hypothetical protein
MAARADGFPIGSGCNGNMDSLDLIFIIIEKICIFEDKALEFADLIE